MIATPPTSALPTLPREDRHRLIRYFALSEDLAALAAELADPGLRTQDSGPPPQHSAPSTQHSDDLDEISLQSWASGPLKDCWLLGHFNIHHRLIKSPYPQDPFNDTS